MLRGSYPGTVDEKGPGEDSRGLSGRVAEDGQQVLRDEPERRPYSGFFR